MAGPLTKYAFVNATLRARISKLISDDIFLQMAHAGSLEEVLTLLRETSFSDLEELYEKTGDLLVIEQKMLIDEIALYTSLEKYLHKETVQFVKTLLLRFEIDNLKNALRLFFDRVFRKRPVENLVHYLIHRTIYYEVSLDVIVNANDFGEIIQVLSNTPYGAIIKDNRSVVEEEQTLFRLEIALDHFYYNRLQEMIHKLSKKDTALASRLIGVEIDLQNINWIIRFRNFYSLSMDEAIPLLIPTGNTVDIKHLKSIYASQNVSSQLEHIVKKGYPGMTTLLTAPTSDASSRFVLIERVLDEIMKQEVKKILSGYPFTIGIVLAYFILKGSEIRRLRTIMHAKQYTIAQERIEGLL